MFKYPNESESRLCPMCGLGMHYLFLLFFFVLELPLPAMGAENGRFLIRPGSSKADITFCTNALIQIAHEVSPDATGLVVGHAKQIEILLGKAHATEEQIQEFMTWIKPLIENPSPEVLVEKAVNQLRLPPEESGLFVGILKGDCHIGGVKNGAVYLANSRTHYVVFERDYLPAPLQHRRTPVNLGPQGLVVNYHAALVSLPPPGLTGLNKTDALSLFKGNVLHELLHSSDEQFISDWITANYSLVHQKRFSEVDPLFAKLTRESLSGNLEIDRAFWMVLIESRAYRLTDLILEGNGILELGSTFNSSRALQSIREETGGWLVDQWKLTPKNFYEFGERLHHQMQNTIDRSSKQPRI